MLSICEDTSISSSEEKKIIRASAEMKIKYFLLQKKLADLSTVWPPLPHYLEVKPSLIEDAGLGLFAWRKIKNNIRIGKYRGVDYPSAKAAECIPASHKPYLVYIGRGRVRDGYQMNNHMRWANHKAHVEGRPPTHPDEPNGWLHLMEDGVVYLSTLRDIEAGEEIYIDYGYDPTTPDEEEKEVPGSVCSFCWVLWVAEGSACDLCKNVKR